MRRVPPIRGPLPDGPVVFVAGWSRGAMRALTWDALRREAATRAAHSGSCVASLLSAVHAVHSHT